MSSVRGKPLVLAVDDDRDFLQAVRRMLGPVCSVETLSDAGGLPGALEALEPDLLILDIHMPGLNGVEACRRLRLDNRFTELPVLFLTASTDDDDFVRALDVSSEAFLNKPVGVKDLRRRVQEALDRKMAAER